MRPLYAWARSACRSFLRRLLGCDCHAGVPAADLVAMKLAFDRIVAEGQPAVATPLPPGPEWAPLAEPAQVAEDALWKVPHNLRGRRWYDAVYYCRDVKAKALAAGAAPDAPGQGAP